MKKLLFVFTLGLFSFVAPAFAGIEGLTVTPTADGKEIFIQWNPVSSDITSQVNGYALQWSQNTIDMRTDKPARQWLRSSRQDIQIRAGGFEKGTDYYFRVYTYKKEERRRILTNGSKILKWKWNSDGTTETSEVEPSDPTSSSSSSSSSSSGSNPDAEFGALRIKKYDNFIDFYWSRARSLTSSDYDGFHVVLSKNSDMSDPMAILEGSRSTYAGRIKGLVPDTQYYAKGYFYKERAGEKQRFGSSSTKAIKTIKAINRNASNRAARNIKKIEKKALKSVDAGNGSVTDTSTSSSSDDSTTSSESTESSSSSSSSSNSSSSSSSSSASSSSSSNSSSSDINKRIAELKAEIRKLQKELRSLQAQARKKGSSRNTHSTFSHQSNSKKRTKSSSRKRKSTSSYRNFMDAYKKSAYRR